MFFETKILLITKSDLSSAPSLDGYETLKDDAAGAAVSRDNQRCRFRQKYLPPTVFALETCHACYTYMPKSQFANGTKWRTVPTGAFENGKGLLSKYVNDAFLSLVV